MSNIFLSTSLIFLASEAAGCLDDEGKVADTCTNNVHGMLPAALVTNIAIVSGLLAAFLMPLAGAMVDYTPYRRAVGITVASLMILIQAIQIGTVSQTWFPMAILQGIAGFLYQVQVLTVYAYLPEIARTVGQSTMTTCKYAPSQNSYSSTPYYYNPQHWTRKLTNDVLTIDHTCTHSSSNLYHGTIWVPGPVSRGCCSTQYCLWIQ